MYTVVLNVCLNNAICLHCVSPANVYTCYSAQHSTWTLVSFLLSLSLFNTIHLHYHLPNCTPTMLNNTATCRVVPCLTTHTHTCKHACMHIHTHTHAHTHIHTEYSFFLYDTPEMQYFKTLTKNVCVAFRIPYMIIVTKK